MAALILFHITSPLIVFPLHTWGGLTGAWGKSQACVVLTASLGGATGSCSASDCIKRYIYTHTHWLLSLEWHLWEVILAGWSPGELKLAGLKNP